jgi:hypothetical protein
LLKLKKPAEADVAAIKAAIAIIFFIVFSLESFDSNTIIKSGLVI